MTEVLTLPPANSAVYAKASMVFKNRAALSTPMRSFERAHRAVRSPSSSSG